MTDLQEKLQETRTEDPNYKSIGGSPGVKRSSQTVRREDSGEGKAKRRRPEETEQTKVLGEDFNTIPYNRYDKIWFITDSVLAPITESTELKVAYDSRWGVKLERGGTAQSVAS